MERKNTKAKLTTEEFVRRANLKHGDEYDYSKTIYNGKFKKLTIKCRMHGIFEQEAYGHLKGKGCIYCSGVSKLSTTQFIEKSNEIFKFKYDYSKTVYHSRRDKVIITCKAHGDFEIRANGHLQGRGCRKCAGFSITKEEYIEKAREIHGNKYDYSLIDMSNKKISLICPIHGKFEILRTSHINVHKKGCCFCSESRGETKIRVFLENNNIKFKKQKGFHNCKNVIMLRFDFYLPKLKTCIEYDGEQHFKPLEYWGGEEGFKKRKINDQIKNKFGSENNIKILRIKFDENIEEKLQHFINSICTT